MVFGQDHCSFALTLGENLNVLCFSLCISIQLIQAKFMSFVCRDQIQTAKFAFLVLIVVIMFSSIVSYKEF